MEISPLWIQRTEGMRKVLYTGIANVTAETKRKYRSDNKSGFHGVFRKKDGKFRVSIGFKGERYNLGTYDTFEKAVSARLEAEHLIYGGFLKTYYEWKKMAEKNPGWEKDNPLLFEVEKIDGDIVIRQ